MSTIPPTRGFTLIEILVVIGMIAILATVVLVALNPAHQFAEARNTQRESNVNAILNAVGQRIAENHGQFPSSDGSCTDPLPDAATLITNDPGAGSPQFNLRKCLIPTYLSEIPFDPSNGHNECKDATCTVGTYDTQYTIAQASDTGRITVCSPNHEEAAIPGSKPFCLTR